MKKTAERFIGFVSSPIFLWLTVAWFVFQSAFMAISTNLGISPDEAYHYNLIQLFSNNGWLPFIHDQQGMYSLGEVVHSPFILYHYLLSLPYHLFSGSGHALVILRFFNIGLSLAAIYLLLRLAFRLRVSPLVRNIGLFMLANTLMFVFLSGSINYDNLLFPIIFGSFLLLFKSLDKPKLSTILGLGGLILAGTLTAPNYLPIAAVIALIFIFKYARNFSILILNLRDGLKAKKLTNVSLALITLLLALLFMQRYGLNMVKYHTYAPACDQVNTYQQCLQNGIFSRQTLPKRIISPSPTPVEYLSSWSLSMRASTFGILGHKSIPDNKIVRLWSEALIIVSTLLVARYYRPSRDWNLLLGLGLFYTVLLFTEVYIRFLHSGYNFGIQGRYLFIFLPFLYFLANASVLNFLRNTYLKVFYLAITIGVFTTASLPTYILKTTPDWHTSDANSLILKIKDFL